VTDFNDDPIVAQLARIGEQVAETGEQTCAGEVKLVEQIDDAAADPFVEALSVEAPAELEPVESAPFDHGPAALISVDNSAERSGKGVEQSVAPVPFKADGSVEMTADAAQCVSTSLGMLSSETVGYFKRSATNRVALVESLLKATSPGGVVQVYAEFARTSHDEFIAHYAKIRGVCNNLAKVAYKSSAALKGSSPA
jgi:hypothetical protein